MDDLRGDNEEKREAAREINSLADARGRAGLSQEQLAELVKVGNNSVSRWERGTQDPAPWMRPRLARALNISLDELGDILDEMEQVAKTEMGEAAVLLYKEVKRLRKEAGLSQPELASRVGYTRQYVSLAERPNKNLPSLDLICALDEALSAGGRLTSLRERAKEERRGRRIEATWKAPLPVHPISDRRRHHSPASSVAPAAVPAIMELRDALTDYGFDGARASEPMEIRDLKRDLKFTFDSYQQSRFTIAASRVCALLSDARTLAREQDADSGEVHAVLALSYQAAASVLIKYGEPDLAWIASERGMNAAVKAGDLTVHGSLMRSVAFSMLATGRFESAMRLVESGARFLEQDIGTNRTILSVYGMLFLAGAMAAARFGDAGKTAEYLEEADSMAWRLGHDANDLWTAFGPTNVAIHRVNTAAELGDMDAVLSSTVPVLASSIPVERKVRYLLDVARAHALTGNRNEALTTVIKAERMAPEQVRQHHLTEKVVTAMVEGSPGKPSVELEKLSQRLNLAVAF
ncbi:helix-turn-helix transcriptional regulator [Actinokineospora iranica]|uniref:Helix-turn-helix domain-containing protein n=1 Tax=Actinokineospora iranica TaxID=1271860 RepID=A0A1G6VQJ5_9PSEU|nr:helix-turn-helix transcriptional regulator [Actinokineospora iranica]SDD55819.1 Helix-turn-helix domain-containing protein [Actinokineospora iranica]